ncbi:hypothetical protein VN97_g11581 [Penicillium thymicola]|uniref:Uncharacterized protein n=1 Tax=Penicillium thymicola TaxID=293382 RepID=A0AAI9T6X8_PENTH|nr:hypothetical protein VN97_g11581 [Penicillium thymicola]
MDLSDHSIWVALHPDPTSRQSHHCTARRRSRPGAHRGESSSNSVLEMPWKCPRLPQSDSGEIGVRGDVDEHVRIIVDNVSVDGQFGVDKFEIGAFAPTEAEIVFKI